MASAKAVLLFESVSDTTHRQSPETLKAVAVAKLTAAKRELSQPIRAQLLTERNGAIACGTAAVAALKCSFKRASVELKFASLPLPHHSALLSALRVVARGCAVWVCRRWRTVAFKRGQRRQTHKTLLAVARGLYRRSVHLPPTTALLTQLI